jgi:hypothetical protein
MSPDPIVEEIHKFREEYAQRFNNDLKAIFEDAKKLQGQGGRRVVPVAPRPASGKTPGETAA